MTNQVLQKQVKVSYGHRGIIGVINISSTVNLEPEYYAMIPEGLAVLTGRVSLPQTTPEELAKLAENAKTVAYELSTAKPDIIVFACTSGSFINGKGYDQEVSAKLSAAAGGIPVVTTSRAIVEALEALQVKKIAFCSPYIQVVNQRAENYFAANGFEIVASKGLGLDRDYEIGRQSFDVIRDLVCKTDSPEAQAVVISCTNLKSVELIAALEAELGKPVISANQATLWLALRKIGIHDKLLGLGKLFTI